MSVEFTALTIDDFSGGITDYTLNAPSNKAARLDNFLINPNKKAVLRPGSQIYDSAMYQIPDGNQRITDIIDPISLPERFYLQSARKVWYPDTTFTELLGPTGNPAFTAGTVDNFISWAEWNGHIFLVNDAFSSPMKIYNNSSGVPVIRNAGLPDLATSPTVTAGSAGANSYVYAFHYRYSYILGAGLIEFEDDGPITLVQLTSAAAPNSNTVAITAIPVLANGATENRDTTAIKVEIYRTINGGNTYYRVGEVTNGTTTFNDSVSDSTLQANNVLIYSTGGVLENDPPPACKYVHVVNGYAYYGHIIEGTQTLSARVRQSLRDDPDSVPGANFVDLKDAITGISSFNNNPIVFGTSKVYRLDGTFDDLGQGGITYEEISKVTGCVSARSIVQTRDGVFFAGVDGFYHTDGYTVRKISDSLSDTTYASLTSTAEKRARIYGRYDPPNSRVYFAVQSDVANSDNDSFMVLDLRWGVRQDSTFTTWSNESSFAPTCVGFFDGDLIRTDYRGYVFKHNPDYQTDPKVDTAVAATSWATKTIIWDYLSPHMDFGIPTVRKWATRMLVTADNLSELSVQIISYNDQSTVGKELKEIRSRDNIAWGNPVPLWGDDTFIWAASGIVEQWRRFPATSLRFSHKQLQITNAYTNIYRSDDFSTANVDATLKTATLTNATYAWADSSVDYYISFVEDDYTLDYLITAVTDTTITYQDTLNTSVTALASKWLIRGYPKGEIFNLQSYVVYYAPLTPTYRTYHGGATENGANA